MSIINQETWEKFSEEEKEKLRNYHKWLYNQPGNNEMASAISTIEGIFGKENLQPKPKPKIRTWADVEESENLLNIAYDRRHTHLTLDNNIVNTKVIDKIIATYKIAYLINKSYGGRVSEEEWGDDEIKKFSIGRFHGNLSYAERGTYEFISFHTPEQRKEFMSYPENKKLVEQYHMI